MYKKVIRPLMFRLSPETIHNIIIFGMKICKFMPFVKPLFRLMFQVKHPILEREVFGVKFPNPVGLAAGFDKNAEVFTVLGSMGFGFIEVGSVTPKAQMGNPKPRLFRLVSDSAVINRMGFNNKGVERVANSLSCSHGGVIVGGNLGKNTLTPNEKAPADYLKLFRRLYEKVDYFVVNVSCPNVANLSKLQNSNALHEILEGVVEFRKGQPHYRPILLKISPDLSFSQIDEAIEVMRSCNLDGIVATNTTTSREGLTTDAETVASIGNGGLSGEPLFNRSLEVIKYVAKCTGGQYPIIGVGGIMTEEQALAMLDAGASLIQVYTGYIYNGPMFVKRICKRIIERETSKK